MNFLFLNLEHLKTMSRCGFVEVIIVMASIGKQIWKIIDGIDENFILFKTDTEGVHVQDIHFPFQLNCARHSDKFDCEIILKSKNIR